MKNLYLVNYWVPFPSSEYGGTVSVIAENDNECHDLLLEWRDDYLSSHDSKIMENVHQALTYSLAENLQSGVVDSFTT